MSLIVFVNSNEYLFLALFIYSTVILLIQPQKPLAKIFRGNKTKLEFLGEIFGIHSKNIYLIKMFEDKSINEFDLIFLNSYKNETNLMIGLVLEKYFLNNEIWIKAISIGKIEKSEFTDTHFINNHVYCAENLNKNDYIQGFVGTVVENSSIDLIKFEYFDYEKIEDGQLLNVKINSNDVIFQVVQAVTRIENLELNDKSGLIIGEATQIGIWNKERQRFDKYGWVPEVNSIVTKVENIDGINPSENDLEVGRIPNTSIPIFLNKEIAIGNHLAILGVTGSGKSVFSRYLIREIIKDDVKIIYVDFTGECKNKLADINPIPILEKSREDLVFAAIDDRSEQLSKFPNQQDKPTILRSESTIHDEFKKGLTDFLQSKDSLSLFELPDVSNTTGILEYTKWFFKILFKIAKEENNFGRKVCLVIEEAHTVVPEWNFIGESQREANALVNAICQIALQGRKYNVGMVIIAQRTANVSKTVLTQCNTIVSFQQFDKTGKEFLSNYINDDMLKALPSLKFRQAIASGRGFNIGIPIIFEVPNIEE